ncbi:MAG: hypothetical protein KGL39_20155 [Patescibacteria group bacterium]|nr:hypothetical protein [Patescibacteria group bacterium]
MDTKTPDEHKDAAPVNPNWLEEARRAFARRWHDENADDFENSPNVYGSAE